MQIRRALALTALLILAAGVLPLVAQKTDPKNQPKRSKAEQQDVETLLRLVDAVSTGQQPAPADYTLAWDSNHFVKGQDGVTYVPFTLSVDKALASKPIALYIHVVEKGAAAPVAPVADPKDKDKKNLPVARPVYPWDSIVFTQVPETGKMSRAIALKPGDYEAYITIKEKGVEQKDPSKAPPAKIVVLKRELAVPDFTVADLKTSSVILAGNIEVLAAQLTPAQQEENPYVFGPMKINPSADGKFPKASELNVVFWIYGAAEAAGGKPDVTIEYAFHQKLAEGEKYFNRTQPQVLNAQSLPPEFRVAAGHQLPGTLTIPLASFPVGEYRLEIKISDKTSGKSVVQNVTFSVTA
jgi:hypothetical protein